MLSGGCQIQARKVEIIKAKENLEERKECTIKMTGMTKDIM